MKTNRNYSVVVITVIVSSFLISIVSSVVNAQHQFDYYYLTDSLDTWYANHPDKISELEGDYKQYVRWKEFWRNRVYGSDSVRKGSPATWLDGITRISSDESFLHDDNFGSFWYQIGPYYPSRQISGLVSTVYVDTVSDKSLNTIYIGTNASGVWKTTNGGQSWLNITDFTGLPNLGITYITGDPNNLDIIYAATGGHKMDRPDLITGYGIGILKTEDGGNTWNRIMSFQPNECRNVYKLIVDPQNSLRIYALVDSCVYRTMDGGYSWSIIFDNLEKYSDGFDNKWLRDIEMHPDSSDILYIASDDFYGWHHTAVAEVWKTKNATADLVLWKRIDTLLMTLPPDTTYFTTERYEIEVCKADPNAVWVLCKDTTNRKRIWKSYDSGDTWSLKYNNALDGGVDYHRSGMKISPKDTSKIYVFGYDANILYNWTWDTLNVNSTGHIDVRCSQIISRGTSSGNDTIYVGNDGGISKSTNSAIDWSNINGSNLVLTQCWNIGGSNNDPNTLYTGTIDNNFYKVSNGFWSNIEYADFGEVVVCEDSTNFLFTNKWNTLDVGYGIQRSSNAGLSFDLSCKPWDTEPTSNNRPIVINPQNPKSLLTAGHNLFKSNDRGESWDTIFLPSYINSAETIGTISINKSDSNVIIVSYAGPHWSYNNHPRLLISSDHGLTWTSIADSVKVLNRLGITGVATSPLNSDSIWFTLGGFAIWHPVDSMINRVYFSSDGGKNWQDISNGLPDVPVNCIKYYEGSNGGTFVGTDVGVYYRDNDVPIWVPFNNNLPKCIVTDLEINDSTGKIRASTFGRGIFESDLSCPFDSIPVHITQHTTWTKDTVMNRSIVIDSLVTFTIKCNVSMPQPAKIYVVQGGKLVVDGGRITSACFNNWQGIEVWGNSESGPIPTTNHGMVWLLNGAVIENSRIGISTCRKDEFGRIIWNTTGGRIWSDHATFRNNYKAIELLSYPFYQYSKFEHTQFLTTKRYIDGINSYPSDFVSMFDVYGVRFLGCTFKNTTDSLSIPSSRKGQGIFAVNSQFYIDSHCNGEVLPCPSDSVVKTKFINLHYGIKNLNYSPVKCVSIKNAEFIKNQRGIFLSASAFADILSNTFIIPKVGKEGISSSPDTCYGLYLGNCTGYHVEDNYFKVINNDLYTQIQSHPIREMGIIVDSSGGLPNEIYRNRFDSLDIAINAQRCNRDDDNYTGLVLKCNTYFNNSFDEVVTRQNENGVEGIARDQGNPFPVYNYDLAGNTFSPYHESEQLPESDILNNGNFVFYYHHFQEFGNDKPRVQPDFYTNSSVFPFQFVIYYDSTCCPSKIDTLGSIDELKELAEHELDSVQQLVLEKNELVDGGSTEALNNEIIFSLPSEATDLQQSMLEESPYLSDTVMKSAIGREDVLPNAMIRDILVANPQSAKSPDLLDALNARFQPMPIPLLNDILDGRYEVSPREILEGRIAEHMGKKQEIYGTILKEFKHDTVENNNIDSLIVFLQSEPALDSKYQLMAELLEKGDSVQAYTLLQSIPSVYSLNSKQLEEYDDFVEYIDLVSDLTSQNGKVFNPGPEQVSEMLDLLNTSGEPVRSYIRNILLASNSVNYFEPILIPGFTKSTENQIQGSALKVDDGHLFSIHPNPVNHYMILSYDIKSDDYGMDTLYYSITGQKGEIKQIIAVVQKADQIALNMSEYQSGLYVCTLYRKGKKVESRSFIVIH